MSFVVDPERRLRDRTFGFRLEELPRTNRTVWFESFCDPDQLMVRKSGIRRATRNLPARKLIAAS